MTSRTRHYRALAALAWAGLLLIAFGLRVWDLGAADLTFDEVATVFVARRPLLDVIRYVMGAAREHPPVYYLVMSLWMRWAGTTEFAIRVPSALVGVLTVAWSLRLGRRLLGRRGAWWTALLLATMPFSVWAGRTGRMYALVLLLSLMIMDAWHLWLTHPDRWHWLGFVALSAVGAMTHYYLVLLWPVQGALLLLLPRRTRPIRWAWTGTAAALGVMMGIFVTVSPGIRAMVLETGRRFPVWGFRGDELGVLITDLYLWAYRPELVWAGLVGLALTVAGWALAWRNDHLRTAGALVAAWGVVPLVLLNFVPERMETRYLTPIFPALVFGVAALVRHLRYRALSGLVMVGLALFGVWRLPFLYRAPDTTFSRRVEILHAAATPDDALLMNGPWPSLLLTYYRPPELLDIHRVPEAAPPGFSEEVDPPRLQAIVDGYPRIWVSYGAIRWADPRYSVSRWLAENAFCVYEEAGMALYVPPTGEAAMTRGAVDLGRLRLREALVDRRQAQIGDVVRVRLDLEGDRLDRGIGVTLGVLDNDGRVWQDYAFKLGPVHQPAETELPDRWREQRGLWLLPGTPPGDYTLAAKIEGRDVAAGEVVHDGWIPLSDLQIVSGTAHPELERLLPNYRETLPAFGEAGEAGTATVALVGFEPYAEQVMQGYLAGVHLWWQALGDSERDAERVEIRLVGPTTWNATTEDLGAEAYPVAVWRAGEVVKQSLFFNVPDDLPADTYQVQARVTTATGAPLAVLNGPAAHGGGFRDGWADIVPLTVEARDRRYRPPLRMTRAEVRFGDVLELRGYRLAAREVAPGGKTQLTVYWQALRKPQQVWAVFNHLRAPDGQTIWNGDSWPQGGIYTTDRWREIEVVAETYTIEIPEDAAPGRYPLYTGVYDPATGSRLPAFTPDGERLPGDETVLLRLEVTP